MCSLFTNLYMLLTWGPHNVSDLDPIYILYLCDQIWLVGAILGMVAPSATIVWRRSAVHYGLGGRISASIAILTSIDV